MSRYYLNLRHRTGAAGLAVDLEGDELAAGVSPRDHALDVARSLIEGCRLALIRNWYACSFEITDGSGLPVGTVSFGDVVLSDEM